MPTAVISTALRPLIEPHLPADVQVHWFSNKEEALALAAQAEIGWFDLRSKADMSEVIAAAKNLRWLNSVYAGLDGLPLAQLLAQGTAVTHGTGINAVTIAEYVVMGMLNIAKGYREVVRAQDRRDWLKDSPGKVELAGSRALVLGYGAIGQLVCKRLRAFEVQVSVVRRSADPAALTPDQWRPRLGEFDWIIVAVPATPETEAMLGASEFAACKPSATVLNVARGSVMDQQALVEALQSGRIGHAFLDVTTPEPLPAEHVLWTLPNVHISMHLSGRAQDKMLQRAAARFLDNLKRYQQGETLVPLANLALGY